MVCDMVMAAKCEGQGWGEPEGIHKDALCSKIRLALQVQLAFEPCFASCIAAGSTSMYDSVNCHDDMALAYTNR